MIGFDPIIREDEESTWWQGVALKDFDAMSLKFDWMVKWNSADVAAIGAFIGPVSHGTNADAGRSSCRAEIPDPLDPKKERVLNYLCIINTMIMTPSNILNVFEKYIGKIENVTSVEYKHIHPKLKKFIDGYKERNKREINLEILSR